MRLLGLATALALLALPAPAGAAAWLAGDGHVHTCASHDSWCPGEPPSEEMLYSSLGTVAQRFAEASAKGLDFLAITDHETVESWSDPAFGANGVIGVHAYENSLDGGRHAQMLGATRVYDDGDDVATAAALLRADGGLFQVNHPGYRLDEPLRTCDEVDAAVAPDTVEVWNPTSPIGSAEVLWECWLQRGARVPAMGGSDSHGAQQANIGVPTTWVLAAERSEAAILDAIRAGRTTISKLPPALGGARLVLEADADRDGDYEPALGETLRPGVRVRARAEGLSAPGLLRVRGAREGRPGEVLLETPIVPGQAVGVKVTGALRGGWLRASLLQQSTTRDLDPNCASPHPSSPVSLCSADLTHSAITSPLYVAPRL